MQLNLKAHISYVWDRWIQYYFYLDMNKDKAQVKVIQTGSYCATRLKWHVPPHNCFKVLLAPHFILLHKNNSSTHHRSNDSQWLIVFACFLFQLWESSYDSGKTNHEKQTNKQTGSCWIEETQIDWRHFSLCKAGEEDGFYRPLAST